MMTASPSPAAAEVPESGYPVQYLTAREKPAVGYSVKRNSLKSLTDNELVRRIEKLDSREREITLSVLVHLIEVDRRKLYLKLGYGSMFEFCRGHLKYSDSTAGRRISAARCIRRYPAVYGKLSRGELNMSTVSKISGILTPSNSRRVLEQVTGRSSREVDMIVSRYRPVRVVRDRILPVALKAELTVLDEGAGVEGEAGEKSTPNVGSEKFPNLQGGDGGTCEPSDGSGDPQKEDNKSSCGNRRDRASGRARGIFIEEMFKIEFGAGPGFIEKLESVRSLLSTKYPGEALSLEKLFGILMDEYIDRHSPQGRRAVRGNRKKRVVNKEPREPSRHIPEHIRDEVFVRDGGRCTYVGPNGRRCGSRWNLQVDHIVPYALGGDNLPSNLRLLCSKHNRLEAERIYGKDFMKKFVQKE